MKRTALIPLSLCLALPAAAAQWSTPTGIAGVNTAGPEFDPSPTADGLTLYFSALQPYEIYRATRTTPYGTFGAPTLVSELNSTAIDGGPCPRVDDREIFFLSNRSGGGGGSLDIWRAERASTSVPFNPPVPVTELNSSGLEISPFLTVDGLRIYFSSTRAGGAGNYDIWTASRPSWSSPFGAPAPVTELATAGSDRDAHLTPDGLTILFTSDRAGGTGGQDLWMASRLDPGSPFGSLVNLGPLNSSLGDFGPSFGLYHDEVFFASDRAGGSGGLDLYSARFTGLLGAGIAGPGSARNLRFSDPSSPGLLYLAASSLGSSPGIPIDTRVLPLNFDLLLQLSIGGLPPVLTGYVGALDRDGVAAGRISFAGFAQFTGLRFFTAFIVLDGASPSGIKTISNPHEVRVQ